MCNARLALLLGSVVVQSLLLPQSYVLRDPCTGRFNYPAAKRVSEIDDYHGTRVADPYRGLEEIDSGETRAWVDAENKLTFAYLDRIAARTAIKARLTNLWNFEHYTYPWVTKEGGRYFYSRNNGLQNQSVLYTATRLYGEPALVLDPNGLSTDGTVAVTGLTISHDGRLLAYGVSKLGSVWTEWHLRDIDRRVDLPDVIKWVRFSGVSFTRDDKGFFYSRYDEPKGGTMTPDADRQQKLYFHEVGTSQSRDGLIYERPDHKDWTFDGRVTDDGRYLIITAYQGTDQNGVYYRDLTRQGRPVVKLINRFDALYEFLDNNGPFFWFRTNEHAPHSKVITIDIRRAARGNWRTIIAEGRNILGGVTVVNNMFIATYLQDAHTEVKLFDLNGKFVGRVELPGVGTAFGFFGKRSDADTFYLFTSFNTPGILFRYDLVTGRSTAFAKPKLTFDPENYETKQVFYKSKDGTHIPMFVTYKRGIKRDGSNPTLLSGYGGFNVSMTPSFDPGILAWMEMGGVYALANLRGGGEYGQGWHRAGMKLNKQRVFDDFISAAEWLVANKYTSTPKLAIYGRSNGGLLVGAALTQRPDLFGAAIPAVGVLDMLRFQKFINGQVGVSEYGTSDNPGEFRVLYGYSPLHNIKQGAVYPPTLVVTADHDDIVFPAHSFKFAAMLQEAQAGPAPILLLVESKAGHGWGKPTAKEIEDYSDMWSFLVNSLNVTRPTLSH